MESTIRPPLFPIELDGIPGTLRFHDVESGEFDIGNPADPIRVMARPIPHVGRTMGYRVTWNGSTVVYISDHQQPAEGEMDDDRRRARPVRRRRPADPRRPVHARGVRPEADVGSLHVRVRGVARRRGGRAHARPVPPRSDARRLAHRSHREGSPASSPAARRCSPPPSAPRTPSDRADDRSRPSTAFISWRRCSSGRCSS